MEQKAKRFWRYFGPALVVLELCNYVVLKSDSLIWQFVCFGFLAINGIIITHLVGIKIKVDQHNARIDAETAAALATPTPARKAEQIPAPAATAMPEPILV